eukprot:CAMPEP_0197523180 /NCGR_PEP_ID=MMETSP1318-20131121/8167_1 /TAXON_ID=552666 /ORGANISM="Partenskyella glossopodia, Strain RCC365" /LENGTH=195 /DNA_ID=CAMNT_0043075785 /DNA_START=262 /DNA_END=849 /DNA_ORIENTATION=+
MIHDDQPRLTPKIRLMYPNVNRIRRNAQGQGHDDAVLERGGVRLDCMPAKEDSYAVSDQACKVAQERQPLDLHRRLGLCCPRGREADFVLESEAQECRLELLLEQDEQKPSGEQHDGGEAVHVNVEAHLAANDNHQSQGAAAAERPRESQQGRDFKAAAAPGRDVALSSLVRGQVPVSVSVSVLLEYYFGLGEED